MILSSKGQSTVEYLLLFTVVIVVVIFFIARPGSVYQNRLNETYNTVSGSLVTASNAFYNSF